MLNPEEEKWINHLSDVDKISVIPHDPTSEEKFLKVKKMVQDVFGEKQAVLHMGASSLLISGQDEIDIYVPVSKIEFENASYRMAELFGSPRSYYQFIRARFRTTVDGKHVDVFVINSESDGWRDSLLFHSYLQSHAEELEKYRALKERLSGTNVREYYREKTEFIKTVLDKAGKKS